MYGDLWYAHRRAEKIKVNRSGLPATPRGGFVKSTTAYIIELIVEN